MTSDSTILVGDAREQLATLPEASVHCCVTSPPYWGLRDYSTARWEGGRTECPHVKPATGGNRKQGPNKGNNNAEAAPFRDVCGICGARRVDAQIGLEATPEEYIETLVQVFRAVRRVLRPDGTLWLNLGDSYVGNTPGTRDSERWPKQSRNNHRCDRPGTVRGLKQKDLVGIPWRVALALQADGWWLRSGMPWVKRSPMPESCTDRPASALEYVFLLTPSPRYYFDMEAVRVKLSKPNAAGAEGISTDWAKVKDGRTKVAHDRTPPSRMPGYIGPPAGRAFRNTDLYYASLKEPHGLICVGDELVGLDVVSEAFKDAHFATFPRRLVEPMIKAGTSEKGCCPECGAPWVRVLEKSWVKTRPGKDTKCAIAAGGVLFKDADKKGRYDLNADIVGNRDPYRHVTETRTVGWKPGCECQAHLAKADGVVTIDELNAWIRQHPPVPCVVLDPFDGAGTTQLVAKQLGRRGIGIELSPEYARMAEKRIANPEPLPVIPDVDGQLTFEEIAK